jgi:hypothetical protein
MNASYTYSHSIDNASNAVFPLLPSNIFNQLIGFQFAGLGNPFFVCPSCTGKSLGGGATAPPGSGSITGSDSLSAGLTTTGMSQALVSRYNIPQDPNNFLSNDRGRSDFDIPHRLVVDFSWQVPPLNKSLRVPKWLDDWTLSGIVNIQSGQPFTIFSGPLFGELTQRANVSGPVHTSGDPSQYISTANLQPAGDKCFLFTGTALPGPGGPCLGNSERNAYSGPGLATVDFAIDKKFAFGETRSLSFRTEFFNLLNRANYYNPISNLSNDGVSLNPEFGQIKSSHDPRQIQFAVRFRW